MSLISETWPGLSSYEWLFFASFPTTRQNSSPWKGLKQKICKGHLISEAFLLGFKSLKKQAKWISAVASKMDKIKKVKAHNKVSLKALKIFHCLKETCSQEKLLLRLTDLWPLNGPTLLHCIGLEYRINGAIESFLTKSSCCKWTILKAELFKCQPLVLVIYR